MKYPYYIISVLLVAGCFSCGKGKSDHTKHKVDSTAIKHKINDYNTQFAVDAANASWAKLTIGKLAVRKGASAEVKRIGNQLVENHTQENHALIALADTEKITIPRVMGREQQNSMDSLNLKNGRSFDRAFLDYMIATYRGEIKRYEEGLVQLSSANIRAFAAQTLPMLKEHLSECEKARAALR